MTGWLRLHRGWRDSDVFADDPCSEREAWLWLIESAAWKSCHRRGGKGDLITVERGQLHTAERTLAKVWKWDRKRVARFLTRLERCEMCLLQKDHSGILITIRNYAKYQDKEADDGAIQGADEGPSEDHRGTTHKEGKEGKEEKGTRKRARPSFELPDWIPEDAWKAFEEMRKAIPKVPFTDAAKRGIVSELEKLKAQGHCPEKLLLKAVKKGWRSVFPGDDTKANAANGPVDMAEYQARLARLDERMGRGSDGFAETRKHATGPPGQPIGGIVSGIVKQAGAG